MCWPWTCLLKSYLCCPWMCLFDSSLGGVWPTSASDLCCTWTRLSSRACVGFFHNRSFISWEPYPCLSKQEVNNCLKYKALKSSFPLQCQQKPRQYNPPVFCYNFVAVLEVHQYPDPLWDITRCRVQDSKASSSWIQMPVWVSFIFHQWHELKNTFNRFLTDETIPKYIKSKVRFTVNY